jgi:predicted DNA-binding transcriptional regulator AlpA
MQDLEPLLEIRDIMRIFGYPRSTVYRRLREARAGRGGLPLPIPTGAKRSLRWNAEDVRKFLENTDKAPPTQEIETATQRQRRHNAAMKTLERFGIKVPQKAQ